MYPPIIWLSLVAAAVVWATRRYHLLSHLATVSVLVYQHPSYAYNVHAYLRFRYPIETVDGCETLPTLPFLWPNGQGNVEKYLRGRENSLKWGTEYGSLYRIWSGFHGEMQVEVVGA